MDLLHKVRGNCPHTGMFVANINIIGPTKMILVKSGTSGLIWRWSGFAKVRCIRYGQLTYSRIRDHYDKCDILGVMILLQCVGANDRFTNVVSFNEEKELCKD